MSEPPAQPGHTTTTASAPLDWKDIAELDPATAAPPPRLLVAGNPVGWRDASDARIGGTLLEEPKPGTWLIQPTSLAGQPTPPPQRVPAARIGALPSWPFVGVSVE
jgi:hypothetical protein